MRGVDRLDDPGSTNCRNISSPPTIQLKPTRHSRATEHPQVTHPRAGDRQLAAVGTHARRARCLQSQVQLALTGGNRCRAAAFNNSIPASSSAEPMLSAAKGRDWRRISPRPVGNETEVIRMRLLANNEPSVVAVECQQLVMCAAFGDTTAV